MSNNWSEPAASIAREVLSNSPSGTTAEPAPEQAGASLPSGSQLTVVRYGRVRNLGHYESERLEAEVYLYGDQSPIQAFRELRVWVHEQLGILPELPF